MRDFVDMLAPAQDRMIVEMREEDRPSGVIVAPDTVRSRSRIGRVLKAGPLVPDFYLGAEVLVSFAAGAELQQEATIGNSGREVRMMTPIDVVCLIESEPLEVDGAPA